MFETGCRRVAALSIALALMVVSSGCQPKPLPEQGNSAELLYVNRCGGCHRPYLPSTMTAAMWSEQIVAMRLKIAQAGQPPMSNFEERQILDYLQRNAGTE
jgi:hypothetical protein